MNYAVKAVLRPVTRTSERHFTAQLGGCLNWRLLVQFLWEERRFLRCASCSPWLQRSTCSRLSTYGTELRGPFRSVGGMSMVPRCAEDVWRVSSGTLTATGIFRHYAPDVVGDMGCDTAPLVF